MTTPNTRGFNAFLFLPVISILCCTKPVAGPDLILFNGKIITMDSVSSVVSGPVKARVQSALEKKSPSTLKLPQRVQRNGKVTITSQMSKKHISTKRSIGGILVALLIMPDLFRKSSQSSFQEL